MRFKGHGILIFTIMTIVVRHVKSPGRRVVDTAEDGRVQKSAEVIFRATAQKKCLSTKTNFRE